MIPKGLAAFAVLLIFAQAQPPLYAQISRTAGAHTQTAAPAPGAQAEPGKNSSLTQTPASTAQEPETALQGPPQNAPVSPLQPQPGAANSAAPTDCLGGTCDFQPPHITIATPALAAAPWPWQQRIGWAANLVLVVFGYVGILIALALLRKIERQTRYAEAAADAAQESARAALLHAEALARAERPWVLISVRPSQNIENGFSVVAANRGRGPARILSTVDEVVSAVDEAHLAVEPVFKNDPVRPADPTILLPGESTEIAAFSRADVKRICESEERVSRVEKWEEKIFLYGRVTYRDLAAPDDAPTHESGWFCWYIHGRQKSGMVMTGSPAYNRHT